MRIIKYIVILVSILILTYCGLWFYLANQIVKEVNNNYAGQKINIKGMSEEFFVGFEKASSHGFPFGIALNLQGWKEESRGAIISYKSPVEIGYNGIMQVVYVSYNGEIDASYKPESNGFGAILNVNDYLVKISLPLSNGLIKTLSKMKDPVELINYVGDLVISTKEVKIIDKQENQLFYHKTYEQLKLSFVPSKHYESMNDLISNIPQEYKIHYNVKTKPVKFKSRKIPASLFYGFSILPSDFAAITSIHARTTAKKIQDVSSNLDLHADCTLESAHIDMTSFKLDFKSGVDVVNGKNSKLLLDSKVRIKEGLFDELFNKYEEFKPSLTKFNGAHLINQEMSYVIANKHAFRFKDLENSDYVLNIDVNSLYNKALETININNLSIYSGDSGFKLTSNSVIKLNNTSNWHSNGVLLLKNYPEIVDFSSGYIYRFGTFRLLDEQARKIYIKVNKEFLKEISDHPTSTSNDLSFKYEADSSNYLDAKVGSVKAREIPEIYAAMLYKKLFGAIDPKGDILQQMKKLIPNLDENDPTFKKLIPAIFGKNIKELIPENPKKTIEEIVPVNELKKKLFKGFIK